MCLNLGHEKFEKAWNTLKKNSVISLFAKDRKLNG